VEVRLGEQGEVQLKGGQVFSGYWRNPQATAEVLEDGWLHTGDVGEIGADGSLAIRGRLKELIISGGYNVYPREVELVLEAHPDVAEAAVAGVPSERWGEEVTAFVVPAGPVGADALIAYARERLAPYKCPRQVHFVEALPRNAMGKIQRSELVR
jgi:malonyl-CoA/methylmalonyl-CoA synthetase